jgi:hypothetical protein
VLNGYMLDYFDLSHDYHEPLPPMYLAQFMRSSMP